MSLKLHLFQNTLISSSELDHTPADKTIKALLSERDTLLAILNASDTGTWQWNVQTGQIVFNEKSANIIGYTLKELLPLDFNTLMRFYHPEDIKHLRQLLENHFRGETNFYECEARMLHKKGNWIWVYAKGKVMSWTDDGSPLLMFGSYQDITTQKNNELALKNSDYIQSQAQKIAHYGAWYWDIKTGSLHWSDEVYRIFGLKPQEFPATYEAFLNTILPEDRQAVIDAVNAAVYDKKPYEIIHRILYPSGKQRIVKEVGKVFYDSEGRPDNMIGVVHDITELKQSEESLKSSEAKFRAITEYANTGVALADANGYILYANKAFLDIVKYSQDEIIGMHFGRFTHPDSLQEEMVYFNEISAGTRDYYRMEKKYIIATGEIVWVDLAVSAIRDNQNKVEKYVGIVIDITKRKHYEIELKNAQIAAESANRLKSEFLANMSHEIRTPMNVILGLGHLILQTELTAKQRDYLVKIHTAAKSLLGIINDILDFSKIEAGRLELEQTTFNITELLDHIGNIAYVKAEGKGLEILFSLNNSVPQNLIGDPTRLNQILSNLVNNAIKFTESGFVILSVDLKEINNNQVVIQFVVTDTGIGIPEDKQQLLFSPFSQVDASTTRKYGGTGLGLSIVKKLTLLMNGTIEFASEVNRGSSFTVTLPFLLPENVFPQCPMPPPHLKNVKALVIDDNAVACQIIQRMLESFSLKVDIAYSGKEAIEAMKNSHDSPYSIIIIDYLMPEMDGLQTLHEINKHFDIHSFGTIIMLTAFGKEDIKEQAYKAGIKACITKPVQPSQLFNVILETYHSESISLNNFKNTLIYNTTKILPFTNLQILLVEDHHINQQVTNEILQSAGIKVDIANNGFEALQMLKEGRKYDMVLMDIQMPVMDGLQAATLIRQIYDAKTLPIIAMTAHALKDEVEKCLNAGMQDHISKPVEPDNLFNTIIKHIPLTNSAQSMQLHQFESGSDIDNIKGVNVTKVLKHLFGNKRLFKDLIIQFINQHKDTAKEINHALSISDIDNAINILHRLKGVAGALSAEKVYDYAKICEEILKTFGVTEDLFDKLSLLQDSITEIVSSVEHYIVPLQINPQEQTVSSEEFAESIRVLISKLAVNDMSAVQLFETLKVKAQPFVDTTMLSNVESAIKKLEFAKAQAILKDIIIN